MAFRAPMIGEWFMDQSSGQLFEIVALDDHSGTIEIQYVDGELSNFDLETWSTLLIEPAAAPEDWSAPYEVASEDLDPNSYVGLHEDPLTMIEPDIVLGIDELY